MALFIVLSFNLSIKLPILVSAFLAVKSFKDVGIPIVLFFSVKFFITDSALFFNNVFGLFSSSNFLFCSLTNLLRSAPIAV